MSPTTSAGAMPGRSSRKSRRSKMCATSRRCGTAVHALDTRDREGFSKSTFRLYGEGIRLTARQILLDAHAANNVNFQTDYDKRVEKIGAVVDGCSLLLEYLTICTEEGIISAKKAGIWTKKVTDVKYPAMKWLTSERGRAENSGQKRNGNDWPSRLPP